MSTKLWDLQFDIEGDDINLEQDMGCGDVARITLHTAHLRLLAERAGLIQASAHADPGRTIARLRRHLGILLDRINHLDECLRAAASMGREDLEHESGYALATWEMAMEFARDADEDAGAVPQQLPIEVAAPGRQIEAARSTDTKAARQKRWRDRRKTVCDQLRALGVTPTAGASLDSLERQLVDVTASTPASTKPSLIGGVDAASH